MPLGYHEYDKQFANILLKYAFSFLNDNNSMLEIRCFLSLFPSENENAHDLNVMKFVV